MFAGGLEPKIQSAPLTPPRPLHRTTQPAGRAKEAGWGSGVVGYGEVGRDAGGVQAGWIGSGDRVEKDEQFVHLLSLLCLVISFCFCNMLQEDGCMLS